MPLVVYQEMVDKQGLTRLLTGLGQLRIPREHVDEARFPHVRPPDKGILRQYAVWATRHIGT